MLVGEYTGTTTLEKQFQYSRQKKSPLKMSRLNSWNLQNNFEMRKLSWIIWVQNLNASTCILLEAEEDLTQVVEGYVTTGRDWNDIATN